MKASNKIVLTSIVIVASIVLCSFATKSWRESRGLTFFSFGSSESRTVQEELKQFDSKLKPVAERRAKLLEQLEKSRAKEREIFADVAERLGALDKAERSELREQFESGKLSDDNVKRPEITILFAKYQEALRLRRHTSILNEQLAKYEYELTRALAERDRLQERAETIDALGFDPENIDEKELAEGFRAIDELAASLDVAQNGSESAPLSVDDVVQKETAQVVEEIFDVEVANADVATINADEEARDHLSDQLTTRLQELEEKKTTSQRKFRLNDWLNARKGGTVLFIFVAVSVLILIICVLGIVGLFAATKEASVVQVCPGKDSAQNTTIVVEQKQGLSEGRIIAMVIMTSLGTCLGGPIGGAIGLALSFLCSGWRVAIRALGVIGFVLISVFFALALLVAGIVALVL